MNKITKKNLTKEQREKLNKALKLVEKCIEYYQTNITSYYVRCMCGIIIDFGADKSFEIAFRTTAPNRHTWWYIPGKALPRLEHMNRIKNEILKYL